MGTEDEAQEGTHHPEERWVKKEFSLLMHHLEQLPLDARARLQSRFAQEIATGTAHVDTPRGPLSFILFGRMAGARGLNLLDKQPATIDWIDGFAPGGVFWDVGANVGTFTLYAAQRGDTEVVAFEPAAVNYFLLSANCEANGFGDRVQALLLGLGRERSIARLDVSQFEPAASFTFRDQGDRARPGRQAAMILTMDELVESYGVPCPTYMKIDAPGMAEAVLIGGERTLQRPDVRELHIELKEESTPGQRIVAMLDRFGFDIARRDGHGAVDVTFVRRRP